MLERRVDEDLDELAVGDHAAREPALGSERRDERRDDDQARIDHEPGDLADAADVLDAIGGGEAEILVQPMADVVAVEQVRAHAERVQLALDEVRDRRFAAAR